MSTTDDRNPNNTNPSGSRGKRCGKSQGRGVHFNLTSYLALTQHLMRQGHSQRPPSTYSISPAIGSYHDAMLNARQHGKNVYPVAIDRDNILQADPT
jgi:hypothetical protein